MQEEIGIFRSGSAGGSDLDNYERCGDAETIKDGGEMGR